jgi:glutathione peroxidase-family protein
MSSSLGPSNEGTSWRDAKNLYGFGALDIDGKPVLLDKYKGRVVLIVNVACKCGLTNTNYEQLQALHTRLSERGLSILAFPCNQFMSQEPWAEAEIKEYVSKTYGAKFDLFGKVSVNGGDAHPLYQWLKLRLPGTLGDFIKWNFSKFLLNRKGEPYKRYGPNEEPEKIIPDIEKLLAEPAE